MTRFFLVIVGLCFVMTLSACGKKPTTLEPIANNPQDYSYPKAETAPPLGQ